VLEKSGQIQLKLCVYLEHLAK